jgi:hypothetical protein
MSKRRALLLLGGGTLGGIALASIGPKHWARAGAALFGSGAWLARLPIAPLVLSLILARLPAARRSALRDADGPDSRTADAS